MATETEDRVPLLGQPCTNPTPPFRGESLGEKPHDLLHHYFEGTCDQHPNRIALDCHPTSFTYRDVDHQANRFAHFLLSRGLAQATSTVGILLNRSVDTYVVLLGIIKAGAAFVPLDPSIPPDRLAFVAQDAALQTIVTTSEFHDRTRQLQCHVLELDQVANQLCCQPQTRPTVKVDPSSVCYIIYTSGSTGKPKGVAISHSSITNYFRVVAQIYDVKSSDRVYQGITLAFDFAIEEIWITWVSGATLVPGPIDSQRVGHGLGEFLMKNSITVLGCVPTLLATVDVDVPSLRTLIVGGEACPADLVRKWARPGRRMLNTYGPTETTITATWCEMFPGRPVTIGVPLPSYRAYLLDDQLRPVKDNRPAEICIGGPGVAIGYINRPELNESCFVQNPFFQDRTEAPRLYRTGDLGRLTDSGEIEYLGRIDTQVKIRGYRIELGEITELLRQDTAVENALVTPLQKQDVVEDLVAYVTMSAKSKQVPHDTLRERLLESLRSRLPAYMIPSFIEVLDEFPLLVAGKINRAALPPPKSPRLGTRNSPYAPPETPLQAQLEIAWRLTLGCESISIDDDFFCELGGHSLSAAHTISRLRHEPGFQMLAVSDLYSHPTIRGLAQYISTKTEHFGHPQSFAPPQIPAIRHSNLRVLRCGLFQLLALYSVLLIFCLPLAWTTGLESAPEAVVCLIWAALVSVALPVIASHTLMYGVQPGSHPLWGITYFRWWLYRKTLTLSPVNILAGSPLLLPYLRILGAKVGRGCHIATGQLLLPNFISIGDGASIGYNAQVQPFAVSHGWLRIGTIRIGHGAFIGTNSVVLLGAEIGNYGLVGEQSLVAESQDIPAHEHWRGSPISRDGKLPTLLATMEAKEESQGWSTAFTAAYLVGLALLSLLASLALGPSVILLFWVVEHAGLAWGLAATPLSGLLFVIATCILCVFAKRLVMFSASPGIYPVHGFFGLRKWLSDQIMAMSLRTTNTLYATLYVSSFLRLLGAKIGPGSEISTITQVDPDMVTIGAGSFVADKALLGPAVFHRGYVALAPVEIGQRSFIGNSALVSSPSRTETNTLIGVHSVAPTGQTPAETSWLGSPAMFLPRRQVNRDFGEDVTYRPHRVLIATRLFIEFLRVTLPHTILHFVSLTQYSLLNHLAGLLSPLSVFYLAPLLIMATGIVSTLIVVALKWLVIGQYRPRVEPLWSVFVWRSELITGLYESLAVPYLMLWLNGTPWISFFLRLFGTKVGRRVWLYTTYLTEFDLVQIDDDAEVGEYTSLQTHLFEDRVMKMSTVKIGAGSSVGSRSVILYDSELEPGASLDALSLVMKGESLPSESNWRGIPACAVS